MPRPTRICTTLFALAFPICASAATAATPYLVRDLNTATIGIGSNPESFESLGSRAVFIARPGFGELWSTDGTAGGTFRLGDGFLARYLGRTERRVFLLQEGDDGTRKPWVTDGSSAGTFELSSVRLRPGTFGGSSIAVPGTERLYVALSDLDHGSELWTTDGTREGTRLVVDLVAGAGSSTPSDLRIFRGRLYFTADRGQGRSLWSTDGTAQGTRLVFDPDPTRAQLFGPFQLTVVGNSLFFFAQSRDGWFLWKTNGQLNGTVKLAPFDPSAPRNPPTIFVPLAHLGKLFFVFVDRQNARNLWVSNGTLAGTRRLTQYTANKGALSFYPTFQPQNRVLFLAEDSAHGTEWWTSDGTPQGTRLLLDLWPGPSSGFSTLSRRGVLPGRAVFGGETPEQGVELWSTDGTAAGTRLIRDVCPGACPSFPLAIGSVVRPSARPLLFFAASQDGITASLWATDGRGVGTVRLAELSAREFPTTEGTTIGQQFVFRGFDLLSGTEPWSTNGSVLGTSQITDVAPNFAGSSMPEFFVRAGSRVLFAADGTPDDSNASRVWSSDGTEEGTLLLDHPGLEFPLAPLANATVAEGYTLLPYRLQTENLTRILRSDGTPIGTFDLLSEGTDVKLQSPSIIFPLGNQTFFVASDSAHGEELWVTDGSAAGTHLVVDRQPGPEGSRPRSFRRFLGQLLYDDQASPFFLISDGTAAGTRPFLDAYPFLAEFTPLEIEINGKALMSKGEGAAASVWSTDGTEAGTKPLLGELAHAFGAQATAGHLLFLGREAPGDDRLFFSDGTPEGTRVIARGLSIENVTIQEIPLTAVGSRWVFTATPFDDFQHPALWVTDGTEAGTKPLIEESNFFELPIFVSTFAGKLLLEGGKLWLTDGTSEGTEVLFDFPFSPSARPSFVVAGDRAYFAWFEEETGSELWALRP